MSGNEVESKGAPDGDGARESEMERYAECGASAEALAEFDAPISPLAAIPYGVQHVVTMFAANLAPIMLICAAAGFDAATTSMMIQNSLLVAGLGTFVQLYGVGPCGARMPLVMGISIAFIALLSSITAAKGYGAAVGAVLIGGVVEAVLGLCAKYWQPFVNHVVAGTVVTSIGFSLLKVGASSFGGGSGAKDFGSPEIYCWGPFLWLSAWLSRSWRRMT